MAQNNLDEDERRQHFRIDMEKELIDIAWVDENKQPFQKQIACLDFARGGLRINCDQPISIHTPVVVIFKAAHHNSQKLSTKVLRCNRVENSWFEIALIFADD